MEPAQPTPSECCSLTVLQQESIAALSRAAVSEMMKMTNISLQGIHIPPAEGLIQPVGDAIAKWNLQMAPEKVESYILSSVHLAVTIYGYMEPNVQCQIALYAFCTFCVDDFIPDTRALEEFATRLCAGKPQLDPLLGGLAEVLACMPDFYLPYAAQAIVISTIQFVNSTAFDKNTRSMTLHDHAILFPEYRRIANGIGEAFTVFAWDKHAFPDISSFVQVVPDVMRFLCYANDVFSFYKEERAGEQNNYMHDLSTVTRKDVSSVMFDVVQDVAACLHRARAVLDGDALDVLEHFIQGYTFFHFTIPRYEVHRYLDVDHFLPSDNRERTATETALFR
ncbi:hypothetical protein NM688_g2602 [Phlebia brevispora]|uniref:Uncharacterized protein n=1 Tax=Phlebia brevispora TaxID=194682 RepID=A0ACC1T8B8_9APHY|nr:hypothetical protein NM688_g2602 [Phlebia brevispora]